MPPRRKRDVRLKASPFLASVAGRGHQALRGRRSEDPSSDVASTGRLGPKGPATSSAQHEIRSAGPAVPETPRKTLTRRAAFQQASGCGAF